MKFLASLLLVLGVARYGQGLTCYDCTVLDTQYNGNPSEICLHPVTAGGTTTPTKTCAPSDPLEYCLTKFIIKDGVVTEATRDCAVAGSDHDTNSAAIPTVDQCVTNLDLVNNPTGTSTCYFPCTGGNCNTKSAANVLKCASDCTATNQDGCNYITGDCKCTGGFTGSDCATAGTSTPVVIRQCVQCNSESDTSCTTSTTAVVCPATQQSCSTTTTKIYASDDTTLKTVTTRGCTNFYTTTDECFFTDIFSDSPISDAAVGQHEVTCVSTCDTDGCNTNTANGVIDGNEVTPLHCVICQYTTADADPAVCRDLTSRTRCPSGSTHCKSTVSYLISERTDLSYSDATPAFKLRNIERACASAEEITNCTETDFGTHKAVTCIETCQTDGCNTGWPARPKCIQCSSDSNLAGMLTGITAVDDTDGYDECLENPPFATDCSLPHQGYCVIADVGIEKDMTSNVQGYPRRITRYCSHANISTGCSSETVRSTTIESCNLTCTTDGCNAGSGRGNASDSASGSSMPIQTMIAIAGPAVVGWLAQIQL